MVVELSGSFRLDSCGYASNFERNCFYASMEGILGIKKYIKIQPTIQKSSIQVELDLCTKSTYILRSIMNFSLIYGFSLLF